MMKKLFSLAAAAVLTLSLGLTSFAASPVKVSADTKGVTVKTDVSEKDTKTLSDKAAADYKGSQVLAVVDLSASDVKAGADVTLSVEGVKKGDTVVLLHLHDGKVDPISTETADDKVTFKAPATWSPFAIVKLASASATASTTATAAATTAKTSPKTGDAATAMIVMVAAAAGILAMTKRKAA